MADELVLFAAIHSKDKAKAMELIAKKNLYLPYSSIPELLDIACENGYIEIIKFLFDKNVSVDTTQLYSSLLNRTCDTGRVKVMEVLLEHGASVNIPDRYGHMPLYTACSNGYIKIVKLLLLYDPIIDITKPDQYDKSVLHADQYTTPLYIASEKGYFEIVKLLLEHKAKVNFPNLQHDTALHLACEGGHIEVVKLLLSYGALVNARNHDLCTPLHNACFHGHFDIAQLLLQHGAVTYAGTIGKEHALLMASFCGHVNIVHLLVQWGANINYRYINEDYIYKMRNHQNETIPLDDSKEYWSAMINLLRRNNEANPQLIGKNNTYESVRLVVNIEKMFKNDAATDNRVHFISQNVAMEYINNPFAVSHIKNKLLLNAFNWYKVEGRAYVLDIDTFNKIKEAPGLSREYLELIQIGDNITSTAFKNLTQGTVAFSNHVYNMIIHRIEKNYDKGLVMFNRYYTNTKDDASIMDFLKYLQAFAKTHAPEDFNKVQQLYETCDTDRDHSIFNVVKEFYSDIRGYKDPKNLGLFDWLSNILPEDANLQMYVQKHYKQIRNKEAVNYTANFLRFLTSSADEGGLGIAEDGALLQPCLFDNVAVNTIIGQLYDLYVSSLELK